MTEWLLLTIHLVGKPVAKVDMLTVNRFPTQQACEVAGSTFKKADKHIEIFTCFEVAKLK